MSSQHETADGYHGEIVRRGSYRAIICRDGIQYILQERRKGRAERPWRSVGYTTTKKALIRLSADLEPRLVPELDALPDQAHQYSPDLAEIPVTIDRRAA